MIFKDALKISFGILLIIIGFMGGLIPIFQGWVFGIPGLIILANYFPPAKRLLNWDSFNVRIILFYVHIL